MHTQTCRYGALEWSYLEWMEKEIKYVDSTFEDQGLTAS